MRRRRMRRFRTPAQKRARRIAFLLLLVALFLILDAQLKPLLRIAIANQAKLVSTQAINEAVAESLSGQGVTYAQLITIARDQEGNVQSLDTNVTQVNSLKAALNVAIQEKLNQAGGRRVGIPLGTLIGGDFFRDRGPSIPLRFSVVSNVFCDFTSSFDAAGINQTRHVVLLKVKTEINAMIPGCQTQTEVETEFIVAETIIVGKVPGVYAELGNSLGSLIAGGQDAA